MTVAAAALVKPVAAETPIAQVAPPPAQTGAVQALALAPTAGPAAPTPPAAAPAERAPHLAEGLTPPPRTSLLGRCREIAQRRQLSSTQAQIALAEAERLLATARKPGSASELNPDVPDADLQKVLEKARALSGRARMAVEYGALPSATPRVAKNEAGLAGLAERQGALADEIARLEEKLVCDAPERAFKNHLRLVASDDTAEAKPAQPAPVAPPSGPAAPAVDANDDTDD